MSRRETECCFCFLSTNSLISGFIRRRKARIYPEVSRDSKSSLDLQTPFLVRSTSLYSPGKFQFRTNRYLCLENAPKITRSLSNIFNKRRSSTCDKDLNIYILTWNMNGKIPSCDLTSILGGKELSDCHLVVVATQECETSIEKAVLFPSRKKWELSLKALLGSEFERVSFESLMAMNISVFVRRDYMLHVREPKIARLATGIGNLIGNKGAVAVSLTFKNTSLLFINAHLSAHEGRVKERNKEFNRINTELGMYGTNQSDRSIRQVSSRYDHTFFCGDLNYRIEQPRGYVDMMIARGNLELLLISDELLREKLAGRAFKGFEESTVTFKPTYRFDIDTNIYDSSSKQRVPSWTDRILYKSRIRAILGIRIKIPSKVVCNEYDSLDIRISDHRPVYGRFSIKSVL